MSPDIVWETLWLRINYEGQRKVQKTYLSRRICYLYGARLGQRTPVLASTRAITFNISNYRKRQEESFKVQG